MVNRRSWVVRYRITASRVSGEEIEHVFLRAPEWLQVAEDNLPNPDKNWDSCCIGLSHIESFLVVEDAIGAALRLGGTVHEMLGGGRLLPDPYPSVDDIVLAHVMYAS